MGLPTLTQVQNISDLIQMELDVNYNREFGTVKNTTGGAVNLTNIQGVLVKVVSGGFEFAVAGGEASIVGILVPHGNNVSLSLANGATSSEKFAVLRRGPAIVKKTGIPTKDPANANLDAAAVKAALLAVGIKIADQNDPTYQSVGAP